MSGDWRFGLIVLLLGLAQVQAVERGTVVAPASLLISARKVHRERIRTKESR